MSQSLVLNAILIFSIPDDCVDDTHSGGGITQQTGTSSTGRVYAYYTSASRQALGAHQRARGALIAVIGSRENERTLFRACRWGPIHNTAWLRQRSAEVTWP